MMAVDNYTNSIVVFYPWIASNSIEVITSQILDFTWDLRQNIYFVFSMYVINRQIL